MSQSKTEIKNTSENFTVSTTPRNARVNSNVMMYYATFSEEGKKYDVQTFINQRPKLKNKKVFMFFSLSTCLLLCKIKFGISANSPFK